MGEEKKKPVRRATARRIFVRVTIDESMGELYHWLAALPPAVRSRELVNLVRLGHAISSGVFRFTQLTEAAPEREPGAVPTQSVSVGPATAADATGQRLRVNEIFTQEPTQH